MRSKPFEALSRELRHSDAYRRLRRHGGRAERLPMAVAGWVFGLLAEDLEWSILLVAPHESQVESLLQGARLAGHPADSFSAPSLTPYQATAPSLRGRAQEVETLDRISRERVRLLVATPRALFRLLPSRAAFAASVLGLANGLDLDPGALAARLQTMGYSRVDLVGELGDFAVRGGVVDCFPVGCPLPIRVDFFGDTIETLRTFDPGDQRSRSEVEAVRVPPMGLFSRGEALARVARKLEHEALGYEARQQIIAALDGHPFAGWESFLPLLAERPETLLSWLGDESAIVVVQPELVAEEVARHARDLERDYALRRDAGQIAAPPDALEHSEATVLGLLAEAQIAISDLADGPAPGVDFAASNTDLFHDQLPRFPVEVSAALSGGDRVLVAVESADHRVRLERLCQHYELPIGAGGVELVEGRLDRGFRLGSLGLWVYAEAQLFKRAPAPRRPRPTAGAFLSTLRDLRIGDFVVHQDHGIGQFAGLRVVGLEDDDGSGLPPVLGDDFVGEGPAKEEVIEICYADGRSLLLPPSRMHLIQRYWGGEGLAPRLDRLGGTSWARAKERARKGVRALAVDLLKLYAERQLSEAPRLAEDSDLQRQFEAAFAHEPTADQLESIGEIKSDLEGDRPMDRLLCGDVGFGKTEVAMRAAFKAVDGGFQVAVLAPTTVLADQHFDTFRERFAGFPVEIEMVSRFRSAAEIRGVSKRLVAGQVDILIGTHRLLSRDIEVPKLGLLIVDEEQRFGVAQKERLKELKKNVHVLALTATPVPRTLQLSLAGVRDLSTIETAPRDRLAIETAIVPFSDELIREAIEYELDREGQVYYVYNRVAGIEEMAARLRRICPGLSLVIGHGQLDEGELSKRMHAFKAGEHDVLLATTIIENGIDIPNVNTMIVDSADRFGLAQLYQLRGRVGRSSQLAYCYLLVSPDKALTETSRKRLEAIREFTELGAGFRVAARDLEIRGAGDFLGAEQSGHMTAVGMESYLKLLDDAVRELRGEAVEAPVSTAISLPVTATIPEEYVGDTNLRMEIYRRIASSDDEDELVVELEDRFGPMPDAVRELIGVAALRRRAEKLRIQSITGRGARLKVRFRQDTVIPAERLIRFVGENPSASFSPGGVLSLEGIQPKSWVVASTRLVEDLSA